MQIHEITWPKLPASLTSTAAQNQAATQAQAQEQTKQYVKQLAQAWTKEAEKLLKTNKPVTEQLLPITLGQGPNREVIQPTDPRYKSLAAVMPKQSGRGLADPETLKRVLPTLISTAKKTNNRMTTTELGNTLAQVAPTVWKNTPDKGPMLSQIAAELAKSNIQIVNEPNKALAQTRATPEGMYRNQFTTWADAQLASKIPGTNVNITMDDVRKMPDVSAQLQKDLADVVTTMNDPSRHIQAVEKYLMTAVTGMQRQSAEMKKQNPALARTTGSVPVNADVFQQQLNQIGMTAPQLAAFGKLVRDTSGTNTVRGTGNPAVDAALRTAGLIKS